MGVEGPMRIVMLHDRLGDHGGAGVYLDSMVAELVGRGREVHVAAGSGAADGIGTHRVKGLDARTEAQTELEAFLQSVSPDLIHVHNVMNPVALRVAADAGAVMTVHDHRAFCPGQGKLTVQGRVCRTAMSREACAACFDNQDYFEKVFALTSARLDAMARMSLRVLSRYMANELVRAGIAAERVTVVPAPQPDLPDVAPAGPAGVLFVGRLAAGKGVWDAAEAWRKSGVQVPLTYVGTGPERSRLEASGHTVLGWVSRARLSGLMSAARVVVVPSRWQEPFGLVGPEALSVGTPVVAWASGGIPEWHPGGDFLVPWGDVEGLAQAIAAAVN
jgi:glycosyltransferase involved in cell wall biosynthesis